MRMVTKRLSHQVTVSANHRSVCEACDQSEESPVCPDDNQGPVTGDDDGDTSPPHLTHIWVLSDFRKVVVNTALRTELGQVWG